MSAVDDLVRGSRFDEAVIGAEDIVRARLFKHARFKFCCFFKARRNFVGQQEEVELRGANRQFFFADEPRQLFLQLFIEQALGVYGGPGSAKMPLGAVHSPAGVFFCVGVRLPTA